MPVAGGMVVIVVGVVHLRVLTRIVAIRMRVITRLQQCNTITSPAAITVCNRRIGTT